MREVALEFEDEEFVEGFVEGVAKEVVLEVVENGLGPRVDIGWGLVEARHKGNSLGSEKQVLPGGGDEGRVDGGRGFESGEFEGLEGEMVDSTEVTAGELEDGIDGLGVEGEVFGAGDADPVLHVVEGFGAGEKPEGGEVSHAPADGFELGSVEKKAKLSVAGEDEAENESGIHVEVGEDPQLSEDVGTEILGFVDDENGTQTGIIGEGAKAVLELSMKEGEGAGDVEACGGGHFAAEVALGESGEFNVVNAVTSLGQQVSEGAKEDGFAGAGGSHEDGAHPVLDGGAESLEGFVEDLVAPTVLDGNLAGKGSLVKTEVGTKVHGGISGFHGRTPWIVESYPGHRPEGRSQNRRRGWQRW
jgi:hypothetical protein